MKRLKVLHLITHLGVGGATDNTLLTVEGLSRDRYEVHLAAGTDEEDYTSWEDRGRAAADEIFFFPKMVRAVRPGADYTVTDQLTRFMREQNYAVVHTHCAKAGFVGRIAARRAGVPLIVHTYHLFGWKAALTDERSLLARTKAAVKEQLYFQAEKYTAAMSDSLITVSELNRQEALDLKLAAPEKFTTIYSGINLSRFSESHPREEICRQYQLDPARPIVATIGRLSPQKAPLDFVAAAHKVLAKIPQAQFLMIGDGPLQPQVVAAIGGDERIRLMGFCHDVPRLLSVLDVFVLSSLWEGLGRALTEAMIMSRPVAVTNVDGMPELVRHEHTGLIAPPAKPAAMADNVIRLLENPDYARELGRRAHDRVVPAFCANHMVQSIDDLYVRLLAAKGYQLPADAPVAAPAAVPV